jgi:hypothetical protein
MTSRHLSDDESSDSDDGADSVYEKMEAKAAIHKIMKKMCRSAKKRGAAKAKKEQEKAEKTRKREKKLTADDEAEMRRVAKEFDEKMEKNPVGLLTIIDNDGDHYQHALVKIYMNTLSATEKETCVTCWVARIC